jgi:ubiquinone/menaquinone biosynthesis C-methylase UbiE
MSSLPSVAQVAQAFSQAAQHYDAVAGLQRQAADHLINLCGSHLRGQVMDIGCGTGYLTQAGVTAGLRLRKCLALMWPLACWIGVARAY